MEENRTEAEQERRFRVDYVPTVPDQAFIDWLANEEGFTNVQIFWRSLRELKKVYPQYPGFDKD